jgi:hypothetical protein
MQGTALPAATAGAARPWTRRAWVPVVGIFAASRVLSTVLFLLAVHFARPTSRIGTHATLVSAMAAWDGQWYKLVAFSGYPAHLPPPIGGVNQTSAWAFLPAYPYLVKILAFGDDRLWDPVAELTSTAFGFGAALLLAALLRPHVGRRGALVGVLVFSFAPLSFMLQAAYAESMGLFLLLAVLLLVDRRRYLAAVGPTLLLAFTRPGVQAVALTVALVVGVQLWRARRGGPRPARREVLGAAVLAAVAAVSGFAWSWIAAAVTGVPDAYLRTELAWRETWTGDGRFTPGTSWLWAADFWFGGFGPIVLAVLLAGFTALLLTPWIRRLGDVNRLWLLAWALYLVGVFFPQSSTFRLLMPMAPAAGAFASIRSRTVLGVVLVLSVLLQGFWLYRTFGSWQHFWSIP